MKINWFNNVANIDFVVYMEIPYIQSKISGIFVHSHLCGMETLLLYICILVKSRLSAVGRRMSETMDLVFLGLWKHLIILCTYSNWEYVLRNTMLRYAHGYLMFVRCSNLCWLWLLDVHVLLSFYWCVCIVCNLSWQMRRNLYRIYRGIYIVINKINDIHLSIRPNNLTVQPILASCYNYFFHLFFYACKNSLNTLYI